MRIEATPGAVRAVQRVRSEGRDGLVMVLGTGCCESTAPYLYDNYLTEPDAQPVGEVAGVTVMAPKWLADLYAGNDTLIVDVEEGILNDSLSLESEFDCRFVLRLPEREPQP